MQRRLFKDILPMVTKPVRYTGGEVNMIKKDWEKSKIKMVFAFPDVYEIGMSHLGGKILYGLVNEKSDHLMERTFAPWPDMEKIMRDKGVPLYSLESFRPLRDFDVIGFSMQYEMAISNVLNMLDLAGISVIAEERDQNCPLVIAGGPVVFNPEPFAAFFDAFLIGDAEEMLLEFLDCLSANSNLTKKEKLLELSKIEGVYIPALYSVVYNADNTFKEIKPLFEGVKKEVRKRIIKDLDKGYFPEKPIVPYMNIVHDRAVLEVMRGCQRGCRFCHAGIVYRPVRERSLGLLKEQAAKQLKSTGYDEISLASLSTLDYSAVENLVRDLVKDHEKNGVGVSLPSLRVDAFSIDIANEVQKVRKTTLTLAPEAGTQRLRDIINKNVSEEQLLGAVKAAFESGWFSVKLYFMLGLPGETDADLDGITDLLRKVQNIGDRTAPRKVEIRASLACFVPKAHTPFQWQPQNSIAEFELKKKHLLSRRRKRISIKIHDSQTSYLEGLFARGDRRLADVILNAWQNGCKFDSWSEHFRFDLWIKALQDCNIDPDFYTARQRTYAEKFPWDFIDTGVRKTYLQKENERALKGRLTPDCRQNGCIACGVSDCFDIVVNREGEKSCF